MTLLPAPVMSEQFHRWATWRDVVEAADVEDMLMRRVRREGVVVGMHPSQRHRAMEWLGLHVAARAITQPDQHYPPASACILSS